MAIEVTQQDTVDESQLFEAYQADCRIRAYAALEALRQSLPLSAQDKHMHGHVTEPSIRQYETSLDDLSGCGEAVGRFRLELKPDRRPMIHAAELYARVLAVLGYFTIRDAVQVQANETGAALESLIGYETPQR